jgi:hypothetical protein
MDRVIFLGGSAIAILIALAYKHYQNTQAANAATAADTASALAVLQQSSELTNIAPGGALPANEGEEMLTDSPDIPLQNAAQVGSGFILPASV